MKTYVVSAEMTISVHTIVKAGSKKDAIAAAQERPAMSFCHQCSDGNPTEEWSTSGELDGEPTKFKASEQ